MTQHDDAGGEQQLDWPGQPQCNSCLE